MDGRIRRLHVFRQTKETPFAVQLTIDGEDGRQYLITFKEGEACRLKTTPENRPIAFLLAKEVGPTTPKS